MITYEPFWDLLKERGISTYSLNKQHGISSSTIDRLRHDKPITTTTINDLCIIFECGISDIVCFTNENENS